MSLWGELSNEIRELVAPIDRDKTATFESELSDGMSQIKRGFNKLFE